MVAKVTAQQKQSPVIAAVGAGAGKRAGKKDNKAYLDGAAWEQYKDWKRTADGYLVDGKLVPGDDGEVDSWDLCDKCHGYGHRGPRCKTGKLPAGEKTKITPENRGEKLPKNRRGGNRGGGTRRQQPSGGGNTNLMKAIKGVVQDVAAMAQWGGMDSSVLGEDSAVKTVLDTAGVKVLDVHVSEAGIVMPSAKALYVNTALVVEKAGPAGPLMAMVDTGAAVTAIFGVKAAEAFETAGWITQRSGPDANLTLRSVSQHDMGYVGNADVSFQFDSTHGHGQWRLWSTTKSYWLWLVSTLTTPLVITTV